MFLIKQVKMLLLFVFTIITIEQLLRMIMAGRKLLALLFWRPGQRLTMSYNGVILEPFNKLNLRFLNWLTLLSTISPIDDNIFRDRPRDIFIMNHTYFYEHVYWTEYQKIVSEFYDKTFVLLLTILVICLFANEVLYRENIEFEEVWNRFGILMYLRRIMSKPDARIALVLFVLLVVGALYIVVVYWMTLDRYIRIGAISDQAAVNALNEAYLRTTGVNDYFEALRAFQWESIYGSLPNGANTYRRHFPVKWEGIWFPHFTPEFREQVVTNYSYEQLRDVYMHATQILAGQVRLTDPERVKALLYIKNTVDGFIARGEHNLLAKQGISILKGGHVESIDRFAASLLESFYRPLLEQKFFAEAAKWGHTRDHFRYFWPWPEEIVYDRPTINKDGSYMTDAEKLASVKIKCYTAGPQLGGTDLFDNIPSTTGSWLDRPETRPRFRTLKELEDDVGTQWKGFAEAFKVCKCPMHTTEYDLWNPSRTLVFRIMENDEELMFTEDMDGNLYHPETDELLYEDVRGPYIQYQVQQPKIRIRIKR